MTKYIITDPCYILSDEVWQSICNQCHDDDFYNGKFDNLCTYELNKLAGTTNAIASATGYGDWSNTINGSNRDKILQSDFFADSGMVCVVEYNHKVIEALEANKNVNLIQEKVGGAALLDLVEPVEISVDTSDKSWTVIYLKDKDGDGFSSIEQDEEEEEDWDE